MVNSYESHDDTYHGQMRTKYALADPSDENTQYLLDRASIQIKMFIKGALALRKINPQN